ncbi:MAG TPA: hypothetical protein PLN93_06185 [Vicinamibacterales bacterium]|nr:hypothetical protein [Vicinamibacterales bacterium]HOG28985.1 hypothetical protein [Vicinamibacterales bacterium]HPK71509.1 hypothetical protein [Vicinamibacterales bacterium]HPW20097.1 hypothetical protein [Vicinamibacterales bacterium]
MLARILVWAFFLLVIWRAIRSLISGIVQGASAPPPPGGRIPPDAGERMVRDPVCGTFVLPSRSLFLRDRTGVHHFCSAVCREKYRAR